VPGSSTSAIGSSHPACLAAVSGCCPAIGESNGQVKLELLAEHRFAKGWVYLRYQVGIVTRRRAPGSG